MVAPLFDYTSPRVPYFPLLFGTLSHILSQIIWQIKRNFVLLPPNNSLKYKLMKQKSLNYLFLLTFLIVGGWIVAWAQTDVPVSGSLSINDIDHAVSTNGSTAGDITEETDFAVGTDVTMTVFPAKKSTATRFWQNGNNKELRIYNADLKFKVNADGKSMTKIVLNTSQVGTITADKGNVNISGKTITWTGVASEVLFTITKQTRLTSVQIGDTEKPALPAVATIAEFKEKGATGAALTLDKAEIIYAGGKDVYIQDATGGIDIYDIAINGAAANKIISGQLSGIYKLYNGTPELTTADGYTTTDGLTLSDGEATVYTMGAAEAATADNVCRLVKLENVNIKQDGKNFYVADNEGNSIQVYDKFKVGYELEDGELLASITGIVVAYKSSGNIIYELCPRSEEDIVLGQSEEEEGQAMAPEKGTSFAQGETTADIDGILLTFGGNSEEAQYVFNTVANPVDSYETLTEGIGVVPVDDNDKAYNAEQKNLPTKGTFYVFEPTKAGQLAVTVKQEAKKPLFITEDGAALKDFNGVTTNAEFNGTYTFPVETGKTYYIFTTDANLGLYGFKFTPADKDATNNAKDIATFKLLAQDNEAGDTLTLNNAVVTYIKGDNVFVEDASGAINFFKTGIQFYVGQQLNGLIIGQNHESYHMPQLLKTANTKFGDFKVTAKNTPEAKVLTVAEAAKKENLARFVKLEKVVLSNDSKGFKILLDEQSGNSIRIEDHFNVFYELKNYVKSIEGIIAINSDSTFVFWPTSKEGVDTADGKETEMAIEDGKYLLKNVASGLYWGAGNNWGTRASLLDYSEYQTLAKQPDGTYTMETQVSNGGTSYFFGGDYMDGQPVSLTITPVSVEGEEIVDFDGSFYHNWSEVSGTATDNGSANGGVKLNEEVGAGGVLWGNLSGAVPFKDYANITDYSELRFEGTPGAKIRLMCNRVVDEGPIFEIQPTIGEDGKLTVNISDLKFLNGGTPCDFVCLQSIKIPWGGSAAKLTSIQLVKSGAPKTYYTVANGDQYFGNSTEAGSNGGTYILGKGLSADDKNALWEIVPATADALAAATEKNPVDATFMILNPNFGRNNRNTEAWTMEAGNKNMSGGTNENRCAESWRSDFTLSQEIEVPNGVYALTAQAALTDYANLYDGNEYPVVYANEETAVFNNMQGSDIASNMNTLSNAFASGNYKVNTIYVKVTDGKLTIGAKGTRTDTWCIWDNFQLKYYGQNASIENLKGGAESKELDELRKKANDLMAEVEIATVKNALQNAINGTASVSGAEAIKAAIAILKEAVDLGEASKTAKNVLPKMKELIDATNVYTEEAYNEYYGTWLAKYEDGSLTKAEANGLQDPTVVTGWHAQITVDNFLLSAWDTNPDFNNAPYYINSWSVEGDSDGSDFHVPFFEYWTGDGDSLGEKTLTATMNGLEPGEYNVSAWVRVRMKNGAEAPAYGIDLQANDGTPVDVAAGAQIGDSQFFLDNFTATGTVGADGVLNIKFNVAADNNISWLSFKNVKFEKAGGDIADDGLIEIPQDQGKTLDDFARTDLVEGADYNTYTANADLQVAFKMYDIDVKDCDYVIVKFAEPVAAGWCIAFWAQGGTDNVAIPEGATEYKYVFADDPNCAIQNDILPQICMLTLWGAQKPLVAKVTGIYKHKIGGENLVAGNETELDATGGSTKNEQVDGTSYYIPGDYIAGKGSSMAAGMTSKGFKLRTANGSDPKESAAFMVKEGYTITNLTINAIANYAANADGACIKVTKVEVDGKEVSFTGGEFPAKGAADCGTVTISGVKAKESIKFFFDNSNAAGTQLNIAYAIDYLAPATVGVEEVKTDKGNRFEDGAIYNLNGQKVSNANLKKGLYIINGRKVMIK